MAGLRENQKADRRKRILTAAREQFVERGYETTTIESIAEHAEVSAVTIYNHYGTKGGLLLALVSESDALLIAKVSKLIKAPPSDPLEAALSFANIIHGHAMEYLNKPIWRHVIATSIIEGSSDFGHGYAELDSKLAGLYGDLLETLKKRGKISPDTNTMVAGNTLFSLENARFVQFMANDAMTEEELEACLRTDLSQFIESNLSIE